MRHRWGIIVLAAALLGGAGLAGPAAAQTVVDRAKQAEKLAADGKYAAALDALDGAADTIWEKAPLMCRRILWVADKASVFGAYIPRETDTFKSGEPMIAYAEPIGFGWRKSGDIWHTDLVADFIIRDPKGKELFRQDDFGKFEISSRIRNREFMMNLTYTVTGAPAGEYVAETHLRDKVTGKQGSCNLKFVVK